MRLTLFTDYALRALIYLGLRPQQRSSIAEIGLAFSVAENHMAKIAHALGQAGLVKTTRGRNGGLQLAQPAARAPSAAYATWST
jgi:Rrf2 family nitric oxide-sensitive transcriptional repressor